MINKILIYKPKINTSPVKKENQFDALTNQNGVITPTEISELQGSLIELNNDKFDLEQRTSGIDLRTRLFNTEICSIIVIDTLIILKFLPTSISSLTLQKKRLAVSLKGLGRKEIVDIVQGKRENDNGNVSLGSKIKGMFGGQN